MNRQPLIGFICFLGILSVTLSCGKKGPPFLPERDFAGGVRDLKGERVDGYILLNGIIYGLKEPIIAKDLIKGCRVFYAQYPPEGEPCPTCPIEYQGYHIFGAEVISGNRFLCKVPARMRRQVYFFTVKLIGPEGAMGPPSDMVKVVVE